MPNGTGTVADLEYLIKLVGPEQAARFSRELTAEESARVDEALARYDGDPVAALGAERLPADVQAEIRRVMR